jgi:hypothetical protein
MSFGFPAYYRVKRSLINSRHATKDAVIYSLGVLGWEYTEANGIFVVKVSRAERMIISVDEPNTITIESKCKVPMQCFDWGQNKKNVEQFLVHFDGKEQREAKLPNEPNYLDAAGKSPIERLIDTKDEKA